MKKLNNCGFALVETLVVSLFVMGIFSLLYTNYYPLIGEYEKREVYDNIDSVYKTDLIKKFIKKYRINLSNSLKNQPTGYTFFNDRNSFCSEIGKEGEEQCQSLLKKLDVSSILATNYDMKEVKKEIGNASSISNRMKEYVDYLPNYSTNQYKYRGRIIVEYKESIDTEGMDQAYDVYKYATLGVDLYDD